MRAELIIWRLVKNNMATLHELETSWNVDDVLRANAVLDIEGAINNVIMKVDK